MATELGRIKRGDDAQRPEECVDRFDLRLVLLDVSEFARQHESLTFGNALFKSVVGEPKTDAACGGIPYAD